MYFTLCSQLQYVEEKRCKTIGESLRVLGCELSRLSTALERADMGWALEVSKFDIVSDLRQFVNTLYQENNASETKSAPSVPGDAGVFAQGAAFDYAHVLGMV